MLRKTYAPAVGFASSSVMYAGMAAFEVAVSVNGTPTTALYAPLVSSCGRSVVSV